MVKEQASKESLVTQLADVGAQFGYSKSRSHPSVRPFIFSFKNRQAVIDLEQTAEQLSRASVFVRQLAQEGKELLWVGNKDEARELIRRAAESLGAPYVASRWLGGTFTNWPQIKSRIERLKDLKQKREKGELSIYTKKERLLIDREIARLERYLASLAGMTKLPAAVIVVDPEQELIVVREAKQMKIPIIALVGSDCDLRGITYPVVANDASIRSIKFFTEQLAMAYAAGRKLAQESAPTPAPDHAQSSGGAGL